MMGMEVEFNHKINDLYSNSILQKLNCFVKLFCTLVRSIVYQFLS